MELSQIEKYLVEISQEILLANPMMSLSGSLSLICQDIKVRRKVKDLDFYLPFGFPVNDLIFNRKNTDSDEINHNGSESEESYFERHTYNYRGYHVDIFQPTSDEFKLMTTKINGISLVVKEDIIRMKVQHSFDRYYSRWKHKDDVIFIMAQISDFN